MAAKTNTDPVQIDKSSFFWTGRCAICHPGGGASEFDRFDQKYYDPVTDQFGFEVVGKQVTEVGLDGDYTFIAGSGVSRPSGHATPPAAWDKTWTSEPDCLMCHRSAPVLDESTHMNWVWRTATLRAMAGLTDSQSNPVPAFMAASAAGQGWFSDIQLEPPQPGTPPTAVSLDIDYQAGVDRGDLMLDAENHFRVKGDQIVTTPRDASCWGCHATPDVKKRGRVWFDPDQDVHFRRWSNRHDSDPDNDIPNDAVQACTVCHTAGYEHQITKGDAFAGSAASDRNYVDFLSCRDCHVEGNEYGAPVPSASDIHRARHLEKVACQTCHTPFKTLAADLVIDNASTGKSTGYSTAAFLSSDPTDPANADKSRWYPSLHVKADSDGVDRVFPAKLLNTTWWGAWHYGADGQPNTADDIVRPIPLWRIRVVTGGNALPGATDDNGDGIVELNSLAEIQLYIERFRNEPNAADPGLGLAGPIDPDDYVLIKGGKLWWLDGTPSVQTFSLHEGDPNEWLGNHLESAVPFSIDHNVLDTTNAYQDCAGCHTDLQSNGAGRQVLVDPFDENGDPVYETPDVIMGRQGYTFFGGN